MEDVRGLFLGMSYGTTPAAVTTNKHIIMSSFKSSGDKGCEPRAIAWSDACPLQMQANSIAKSYQNVAAIIYHILKD